MTHNKTAPARIFLSVLLQVLPCVGLQVLPVVGRQGVSREVAGESVPSVRRNGYVSVMDAAASVDVAPVQGRTPACSVGSSILHNSHARGLHGDAAALAILSAQPPACTAIDTLEAAPSEISIAIRVEPTVVHGVDKSWGGTAKWDSEANLRKHYGNVHFDLAADLSMTVDQYVEYCAQNTADFPYYIYEREYVGDSAQLLDNFVRPYWIEEDLLEIVKGLAPRKCIPGMCANYPLNFSPRVLSNIVAAPPP